MKEIHAGLPVSKSLGHTWGMMSKVFVWRARAMIATLVVTTVVWGASVEAGELLFASDEIFDLTVRVPLSKLMRQAKDAPGVAGRLEFDDGRTIPMSCNKYGISRLRECQFASLVITVSTEDVAGTPFDGFKVLRLVTPCRLAGNYDKYTLLEYLVYRSYAVLAEPALRVRLVRARFQNSEKTGKEQTTYAFFVEDLDHAAARNGRRWLEIQSQEISDLDPAQLTVMTLFQYMIGNTDWSAVVGRPDDRCCHNVAVFGERGDDVNTVVPFDFDQVGVVNPPYAAPPEPSLGIRRVTDRKYRGLCEHNLALPAAIAVFNEKRSDLEKLFMNEPLPYPKARERAWKYIEDFYDTINDPRTLEKKILNECR
jgi:hypothetical protein